MSGVLSVDDFLASEARALGEVPEPARRQVAGRVLAALRELGLPLADLGAGEAHSWLLHAVPERFEPVRGALRYMRCSDKRQANPRQQRA